MCILAESANELSKQENAHRLCMLIGAVTQSVIQMDEQLPVFPSFEYDVVKSNAGTRWKKWIGRLENVFVGINLEDDARKRTLLLHYAGERVYDIYDAEKGEAEAYYAATKQVLQTYFEPKVNTQMDIYNFRKHKQLEGQTLDEFVTKLRQPGKTCAFDITEKEILTQVIQNCSSNRLRRALREPDKTLEQSWT